MNKKIILLPPGYTVTIQGYYAHRITNEIFEVAKTNWSWHYLSVGLTHTNGHQANTKTTFQPTNWKNWSNIIAKQQYDLNMIHIEKDMFCLQMKPQACTYSTKFTSNQEVLISTQSRNINYVLQASTLPHLSASQPSHLKVTPKSTVYRCAWQATCLPA